MSDTKRYGENIKFFKILNIILENIHVLKIAKIILCLGYIFIYFYANILFLKKNS